MPPFAAGALAGLFLAYCSQAISEIPSRAGIPLLTFRWNSPVFTAHVLWDALWTGLLFHFAFHLYQRLHLRLRGTPPARALHWTFLLFLPVPALIVFGEPVQTPGMAEWFAACGLLGMVLLLIPILPAYLRRAECGVPGFFVLCLCANLFLATLQSRTRPSGDEPHYLLLAHSWVHDDDLDLDNNYRQGDSTRFFSPTRWEGLDRHGFGRDLPDGRRVHYSNHFPGTPLLIARGYALLGRLGASWTMAAIAAGVMAGVYSIGRLLRASHGAAAICGLACGWGMPAALYLHLIFPELPAALLTLLGIRWLLSPAISPRLQAFCVSACAAALPWLGMRYLGLAAGLLAGLAWIQRKAVWRRLPAIAVPCLLSLWGMRAYYLTAYGVFRPGAEYALPGNFLDRVSIAKTARAALGLLLDRESGLLPFAPFYALAGAGAAWLWRQNKTACAAILLPLGLEFALVSLDTQPWDGTWSPPARFLVCCVPLLALLLLPAAEHLRPRPAWLKAIAAASLAWSALYFLFPETQWGPLDHPGVPSYNPLLRRLGLGVLDGLIPSLRDTGFRALLAPAGWALFLGWIWRRARAGMALSSRNFPHIPGSPDTPRMS